MQESSGYQLILEEGEIKGKIKQAQNTLLLQGRQRLGRPASSTEEAALRAVNDLDRLERMTVAVLTAADWRELLATP